MFESILAAALPIIQDILWTACAALLAYVLNKVQSNIQNI
jgi:hypothetical protein